VWGVFKSTILRSHTIPFGAKDGDPDHTVDFGQANLAVPGMD